MSTDSLLPSSGGSLAPTPRGVGVASFPFQPNHSLPTYSGAPSMENINLQTLDRSGLPPNQETGFCGSFLGPCCFPPFMDSQAGQPHNLGGGPGWTWCRDGKLKLACEQPVVPVPVIQEVHRRDKIIEVPQVDVVDAVKPRVFSQGVEHEVPKMNIKAEPVALDVPKFTYVDTEVLVPIVTGYTHKFVPKWEIREVPRPVVKYVGKQEVIEVEVPQVKFVDKIVEREVVVDTIEKKIPKIIEVPKYVDTVKYVWKPVEKIIHIERFVPKFDVSLECPAPLIVPYPVQSVKEMPAVMVRKTPAELGETQADIVSPEGTVRVPEEYVREYQRRQLDQSTATGILLCQASACCAADVNDEVVYSHSGLQWRESMPQVASIGQAIEIEEVSEDKKTQDLCQSRSGGLSGENNESLLSSMES